MNWLKAFFRRLFVKPSNDLIFVQYKRSFSVEIPIIDIDPRIAEKYDAAKFNSSYYGVLSLKDE